MTDLAVAYDFEKHVGEYPYEYDRGPEAVRSWEDARLGLNCVAMAHLLLGDLHGELPPPHLHAYEMFIDREHFGQVDDIGETQAWDLIWFGLAQPRISVEAFRPEYDDFGDLLNWQHFAVKHVGVLTGENQGDDPLVLHASRLEGTTAIWPLSEFGRHRRYAAIYGLQRYLGTG